jgi:hypothetical protein
LGGDIPTPPGSGVEPELMQSSTKKLSTLGALIDFFSRVFDVLSKARTVIARCLKIVCSTRYDIAADPEPQDRRVDGIMVMAAFAGVCPGDHKEIKIAVRPMSPLGATTKQTRSAQDRGLTQVAATLRGELPVRKRTVQCSAAEAPCRLIGRYP